MKEIRKLGFDFLPSTPPPPPPPSTSEGEGGIVNSDDHHFFDEYNHHLDAHHVFSTPPQRSEFRRNDNFETANDSFNLETLEYRVENRPNWFGENTTLENLVNGYTLFQDPDLLRTTVDRLEGELPSDLFSGIEKPTMKINDRFGMFSFDLASAAMTYVYEYFKISTGEKVDANFIEKKGEKYYFEGEEVRQEIKKRENGAPYVVSSVRNCLIDFEKKSKQERSVEIFVNNSYPARVSASESIYNCMAAITVAKNLILKGFQVKITGMVTTLHNAHAYYHFIPAKRFNQPFDMNAAAYICGDPRFFRYQGFKLIIYGADQVDRYMDSGLGTNIGTLDQVARNIEERYVPNSTRKQADTRLYFGGSRSLEEATREITRAVRILNQRYGNNDN